MTDENSRLDVQMAFRNVDFYYGKYHALKSINLEIYKRRVTPPTFIAPGAGTKASLLRTRQKLFFISPPQARMSAAGSCSSTGTGE